MLSLKYVCILSYLSEINKLFELIDKYYRYQI